MCAAAMHKRCHEMQSPQALALWQADTKQVHCTDCATAGALQQFTHTAPELQLHMHTHTMCCSDRDRERRCHEHKSHTCSGSTCGWVCRSGAAAGWLLRHRRRRRHCRCPYCRQWRPRCLVPARWCKWRCKGQLLLRYSCLPYKCAWWQQPHMAAGASTPCADMPLCLRSHIRPGNGHILCRSDNEGVGLGVQPMNGSE